MQYRVAKLACYGAMLSDNVSNARRICLKCMK